MDLHSSFTEIVVENEILLHWISTSKFQLLFQNLERKDIEIILNKVLYLK